MMEERKRLEEEARQRQEEERKRIEEEERLAEEEAKRKEEEKQRKKEKEKVTRFNFDPSLSDLLIITRRPKKNLRGRKVDFSLQNRNRSVQPLRRGRKLC
jgi:hypothetical protein